MHHRIEYDAERHIAAKTVCSRRAEDIAIRSSSRWLRRARRQYEKGQFNFMSESTQGRLRRDQDEPEEREAGTSRSTSVASKPLRPLDGPVEPAKGKASAKPKIGDTRPAPPVPMESGIAGYSVGATTPADSRKQTSGGPGDPAAGAGHTGRKRSRSRGRRRKPRAAADRSAAADSSKETVHDPDQGSASTGSGAGADPAGEGASRRRVGRYLMCVHVEGEVSHIAVLEGRSLVEHLVSRAQSSPSQIDGNVYLGRVETVLPGMEAAFVDIGTPKSAVLYWGDIRYDPDDLLDSAQEAPARIEQVLRAGQTILCQVIKNPIGAKGARLTQAVSLPGRFLVVIPGAPKAFGISRRLDDKERRRLRRAIEPIRPEGMGVIVRTAAAAASQAELRRDFDELKGRWEGIIAERERQRSPALLYSEPGLALRVVREELNREYRAVVVDDPETYEKVRGYVASVNPDLLDRVEYYDTSVERLSLFERYHVHEQLQKALDRKVWLPSGGSLIIERTEALTVIDVNTGRNVRKSNLEETVYKNNLEAAEEIARQLRLRDIGGIIVIDFIDMEQKSNRANVAKALKAALARDKTRTQVSEVSALGLVEMTRKRVSEGLVESLSEVCPTCSGRGIVVDELFV